MGRSYFVEESVESYLSSLIARQKHYLTGLFIGQLSPQRDFVVLAVRTPSKEEPADVPQRKGRQTNLDSIDEEWVTEHARQVSRMLPGGLCVLGVFLIASPELSKEALNTLRKLVFSVEKSVMKTRLWSLTDDDVTDRVALHLCSATKKIICRTYDVHDAKGSAKPAEWKYQSGMSSSWLPLECTVKVDVHIPLPATTAHQELKKSVRDGLSSWAVQVEKSIFLLNGQVKAEEAELLQGQKKTSRGTFNSSAFSVRVLAPWPLSTGDGSTASAQACKCSVHLKGAVKCCAFIHSNKPKVKEALQALKRDILNSVSDRCEALFEDLVLDGPLDKKDAANTSHHALPRRVFAPIAGSAVKVCDYMFVDETVGEIRERFLEMLDQDLQDDNLDISEAIESEMQTLLTDENPRPSHSDKGHQQDFKNATILFRVQQNIGVVVAAACAVLATAVSLNYYID